MKEKVPDHIWVPDIEEIKAELEWIKIEVEDIGVETLHNLAKEAAEIRKNAYAPNSGYWVGASLLTKSGEVFSSCNAEEDTYDGTDHAETGSITQAISKGEVKRSGEKFIRAVAVSHSLESGPCGACRQRISKHADNAIILDVDENGSIQRITSLKILLPYSFNPSH